MAEIPNVSVIVPMYNVEKYISECLDSVLAQTMQNFELIVVDDCSTDNSYEIVESYIPKFNGRLNLMKLQENTGHPSQPRNHGLEISRGKYIFFMDSDDVITKTALEEMYNHSEKFQADVVCCSKYYKSSGIGKNFLKNIELTGNRKISAPIFLSDNVVERLNTMYFGYIFTQPWLKFSLRDFLIKNNLKFHSVPREDDFWNLQLALTAKRFLLIPNACYIARTVANSRSVKVGEDLNKYIHYWLGRTMCGFKFLDEFISNIDFFKANPKIKIALFNHWVTIDLNIAVKALGNLPPDTVHEIFMKEFKNVLGDDAELVTQLFISYVMLFRNFYVVNQKIMELTPPPHYGFTKYKISESKRKTQEKINFSERIIKLTLVEGVIFFCKNFTNKKIPMTFCYRNFFDKLLKKISSAENLNQLFMRNFHAVPVVIFIRNFAFTCSIFADRNFYSHSICSKFFF